MKKENKDVVVITGASAGLGRAIAKEFASHGARVALIKRQNQKVNKSGWENIPLYQLPLPW